MCAKVQLSSDERGRERCHLCAKDRSAESWSPAATHIYTMHHIHGQHICISYVWHIMYHICTTYMVNTYANHTYGTLGGIRHIRGNQPICRTIPVARWSENMWKKEIPICLPPRCERLISKSSHLGRGNRRDIKEIQTEKKYKSKFMLTISTLN